MTIVIHMSINTMWDLTLSIVVEVTLPGIEKPFYQNVGSFKELDLALVAANVLKEYLEEQGYHVEVYENGI